MRGTRVGTRPLAIAAGLELALRLLGLCALRGGLSALGGRRARVDSAALVCVRVAAVEELAATALVMPELVPHAPG